MEKKIQTQKQRKGITLIALVLTIIVLLILAGITINLTIGQDGILKRAEDAGKNYTQAAEKEKKELAQFSNLTDKIIDNVTKNHYIMVDGVPVPKGFSHKEGTKETGFVIKNNTDGNEFVWVPCTIDGANGSIKYDRYAFSRDEWASTQTLNSKTGEIIRADYPDYAFTEIMPSSEAISVKTYGGFYIGRYESGVTEYDTTVLTENTSNLTEWTGYSNGKLIIQKGQQVWNYITRDKAKSISEGLYSKTKGDSINSRLCSSYAWDTTLKFIETKNTGYATSSTEGNYKDKTFGYLDLKGDTQTKDINQSILVPTGQTKSVNNIYDMGGNTWEWITEDYGDESFNCGTRGGVYNDNSSIVPAAERGSQSKTHVSSHYSFRTTLYL